MEEAFYTIQGEGPLAGEPAIFVRVAGCWLACYWCDTEFEENIDNYMSPEETLALVKQQDERCKLIVLTGGDPLRQNIVPFCTKAVEDDYHVQIETAGIQWVPGLESLVVRRNQMPGVSIVCSPKTGHVCHQMRLFASAWKYIISAHDMLDDKDGLPVSSTQHAGLRQPLAKPDPGATVFVQPCATDDADQNLMARTRAVEVAMRYGYRLSLQQHKILGLR